MGTEPCGAIDGCVCDACELKRLQWAEMENEWYTLPTTKSLPASTRDWAEKPPETESHK